MAKDLDTWKEVIIEEEVTIYNAYFFAGPPLSVRVLQVVAFPMEIDTATAKAKMSRRNPITISIIVKNEILL